MDGLRSLTGGLCIGRGLYEWRLSAFDGEDYYHYHYHHHLAVMMFITLILIPAAWILRLRNRTRTSAMERNQLDLRREENSMTSWSCKFSRCVAQVAPKREERPHEGLGRVFEKAAGAGDIRPYFVYFECFPDEESRSARNGRKRPHEIRSRSIWLGTRGERHRPLPEEFEYFLQESFERRRKQREARPHDMV